MFKGSIVALVTPFKNGEVDEKKLRDLVEFQIARKTSGLVPCGTTGESPTLSYEEHGRVIEVVVEQARGRVPVIAGTGSNSTAETIEMTRHARESGADASLIVLPYYNKPTQRGMVEHIEALIRAVKIPIVLYNIPGRTGVNMLPSTVISLARKHREIVGIKEATGVLDQTTEIAAALKDRKDFSILSGDDSLTLPIMAAGGKGVISVLANIAPREVSALCDAMLKNNIKKAQELHWNMFPLIKALFIETNPIPVKEAMAILGLCSADLRLPLCAMSADNRKTLAAALKAYGLKGR